MQADAPAAPAGWKSRARLLGLGVLTALALPPVFALPLWSAGFVGLVLALDRAPSARAAFGAGWWFTFGHHLAGLYWIAIALLVDVKQYAWLIPFAVSLIPAALALLGGLVGLAAWKLKRWRLFNPITVALLWSLSEWFRGESVLAFPWNPAASVWAFADAPLQLASVIGSHGLGLVTMVIAVLPAFVWLRPGRPRWPWAAAACGALAVFAFGWARLPSGSVPVWEDVPVRVVQASIPQSLKWNRDLAMQHVARHLYLSAGPETPHPALVIWPEVAVPFLVEEGAPILAHLARGLYGQWLLTGATRREAGGDPHRIWNSIVALSPEGEPVASYDKIRLVPFGEFIPFRAWIPFIDRIAGGLGELTPGEKTETLDITPTIPPFAGLVCYEAIFTRGIMPVSEIRPQWLLNVTNDAWFGNSSGPYQHLHQARLRAVEYGLPLVRAANTGVSAVIDPYGRVLRALPIGAVGTLEFALPKPLQMETIYYQGGSVGYIALAWICALISLVLRRNAT